MMHGLAGCMTHILKETIDFYSGLKIKAERGSNGKCTVGTDVYEELNYQGVMCCAAIIYCRR